MAATEEEVRQKIDRMYARLAEESYYELLDVPKDVDERTVTKKFRALAKDWHADRYSGYDLSTEYKEKLQEIFSRLNTAQQTLGDSGRRAEYDMELAGGTTDVGAIIDAESAFRRGKNMLQTGSYRGAHEQFKRAVELHPEEREYQAALLYTEYLQIPKNDEGTPLKRTRAQEIYSELQEMADEFEENDSVCVFLGTVAMGLDDNRKAERYFREAKMINPSNVTAQRQLRLINMRREKGSQKGFFAKLMERFK